MKTPEPIKKAMRQIRKDLSLKVVLAKTAHQVENAGNFDVLVFVKKDGTAKINYPRNEITAMKIRDIIIRCFDNEDFYLSWNNDMNKAMTIRSRA